MKNNFEKKAILSIFLLIIFMFLFLGTTIVEADEICTNPGPSDSNYTWVYVSSNCQTAGAGTPSCTWTGGTCNALTVTGYGSYQEYSEAGPNNLIYCETEWRCDYSPSTTSSTINVKNGSCPAGTTWSSPQLNGGAITSAPWTGTINPPSVGQNVSVVNGSAPSGS